MKPSKTAPPGRLLTQIAADGRTGALVIAGQPGGTVYLIDGAVSYAESPAAPGVGELLTASGRLAARTWQAALDAGTSLAQVGRLLVEEGHLTVGELELCVLGAIYDAAYFALSPAATGAEFLDGAAHWLGPVIRVEPAAVNREARRRVKLLDEIFPDPRVDTAPVIPAPRPPRERVTITAPQWELLVHADGQRTPADLAQLLGRAGYATIQELRRLAALGLLDLPVDPPSDPDFVRLARVHATSVDVRRPGADGDADPGVPPSDGAPQPSRAAAGPATTAAAPRTARGGSRPSPTAARNGPPDASRNGPPDASRNGPADASRNGPADAAPGAVSAAPAVVDTAPGAPRHSREGEASGGPVYRPPRLARRKPGAKLPKDLADGGPLIHPGTDEVLLKRIRTALRALR